MWFHKALCVHQTAGKLVMKNNLPNTAAPSAKL